MEIYLDNNATTKVDPSVIDVIISYLRENYGNASSIHKSGVRSSIAVEKARKIIADKIGCLCSEIYFTSGGTESNNFAIKGVANTLGLKSGKNHIITSSIEHPSILEVCRYLQTVGYKVTYIPVDKNGFVNIEEIAKNINENTFIVSIMHANNEIGTIEPLEEIGKICRKRKVLFHTDACQSFTKTLLDVNKHNIDLATLNSHKVHGPKGIGALYIRKGVRVTPLLNGGGQESDMRPGTYNTPLIAGFGKAVEIASENDSKKIASLRDYFIDKIICKNNGIVLNGPTGDERLCNNINILVKNLSGKKLFRELNKRNIFISTGSACSSTVLTPSHVLLSIGCSEEESHSSVRISLSKWTTKEELEITVNAIEEISKSS
ncbi:MAG: cysteine desulfurase family protein [Bacteroidota bacterium]|nr:cysteine desulfurase family protein [Bacteroidota bacterium]